MNHKNHGNLHAGRPGMTATPVEPARQMKIDHGHDGTHVVLIFSIPTKNLILTPEQADDLITKMQNSKAALAKHQQEAANG